MYWKLRCEPTEPAADLALAGRFVIHRHRDRQGEHMDLRIEQCGALVGWRIDALDLEGEMWASEKQPHPTRWLEDDGGLVRVDAGVYGWTTHSPDRRSLLLRGRDGDRLIHAEREASVTPSSVGDVIQALKSNRVEPSGLGRLLRDGVRARERAVARLYGLGRELDGEAFDEAAWRSTLGALSLDEICGHLRAFEVRFDAKYPPEPVSRPERLPEEASAGPGTREAWRILRD